MCIKGSLVWKKFLNWFHFRRRKKNKKYFQYPNHSNSLSPPHYPLFYFSGVQCESICDRGRFGADCQSYCDCEHGSSCEPQSGNRNVEIETNLFSAKSCIRGKAWRGWDWWEAVWPNLAKFCHFGKILNILGKIVRLNLVFGEFLILFWQKYDVIVASFHSCRCPNILK